MVSYSIRLAWSQHTGAAKGHELTTTAFVVQWIAAQAQTVARVCGRLCHPPPTLAWQLAASREHLILLDCIVCDDLERILFHLRDISDLVLLHVGVLEAFTPRESQRAGRTADTAVRRAILRSDARAAHARAKSLCEPASTTVLGCGHGRQDPPEAGESERQATPSAHRADHDPLAPRL